MITWQKILREEVNSADFELIEDNDKYVVDGVMNSYKAKLTAHPEQVKEILDGAYKAGFVLTKRRYTSKTIFVLNKAFKNANMMIQFSVQPGVLFVCEIVYGTNGDEQFPTAKKSKYFPVVFNEFDKTLPLEFMQVTVDKDKLKDEYAVQVKHEYEWDQFFDYVYSFMIVMLEKLNDPDKETYLEESVISESEELKENNKVDALIASLKEFNSEIRIEEQKNLVKNELCLFVEWHDGYYEQSDETKNNLNTIIVNFEESIKDEVKEINISRARTFLRFVRTIFIKY